MLEVLLKMKRWETCSVSCFFNYSVLLLSCNSGIVVVVRYPNKRAPGGFQNHLGRREENSKKQTGPFPWFPPCSLFLGSVVFCETRARCFIYVLPPDVGLKAPRTESHKQPLWEAPLKANMAPGQLLWVPTKRRSPPGLLRKKAAGRRVNCEGCLQQTYFWGKPAEIGQGGEE